MMQININEKFSKNAYLENSFFLSNFCYKYVFLYELGSRKQLKKER